MSDNSPAWLLDCGGGVMAALNISSVLHVIEDTSLLFHVPLAPAHCNHVLLWQERLLPAADLAVRISGATDASVRAYACVLGWRNAQQQSEYGALLIRDLPRRITVSDEQLILPADVDAARWKGIAVSFFSHLGRTTPIIDVGALFESRHRRVARQVTARVANYVA